MSRVTQFNREMESLINKLTFAEFYEVFREKLFFEFDRLELFDNTKAEYKRAIRRLIQPQFQDYLVQVYRDYDEVRLMINDYYDDLGDDISRTARQVRAIEEQNQKNWGKYEESAVRTMATHLRESRMAGETVNELAARFRQSVDGKIVSYADTLARTMVKSEGRVMKVQKSRNAEVFYFAYTGPPVWRTGVSMSHRLCIELYNCDTRQFHIQDIKQMRNGQREPVLYYAGGYRCRHDWEPDPLYDPKSYNVYFIEAMDGKRIVKVGRHRGDKRVHT